MPTSPKPKTEAAEGSAKHVQSKQQRHQNYAIDIVVVSSSSSDHIPHPTPMPHVRPQEGKHPLGHKN